MILLTSSEKCEICETGLDKIWVCFRNICPADHGKMVRHPEGSSLFLISMITRNQWHNALEPLFIHSALLRSAIMLSEPLVPVLVQQFIVVVNATGYQGSLNEKKMGSNKAQYKLFMPGLLSPAFSGQCYCSSLFSYGRQCSKRKAVCWYKHSLTDREKGTCYGGECPHLLLSLFW